MSNRTGNLLVDLAVLELYIIWHVDASVVVKSCHTGLKNSLGLATLCPLLDTRTLCYTYAGRQTRVKRKKDGAGEKALQAPRNENVQSN